MSDLVIILLLFLPVIVTTLVVIAIQILGDIFEVKHHLKQQPKITITAPLSTKHEDNVRVIKMVHSCNYQNVEILFLAKASQKKSLGKIKYYKRKHKLQNVRILAGKLSKKRAREGNVSGKYVLHLKPGQMIVRNSLQLAVSRIDAKPGRKSSPIILLPQIDNSLRSGINFTRGLLLAHALRAYSLRTKKYTGTIQKQKTKKANPSPGRNYTVLASWLPLSWLATWSILFGLHVVSQWVIVLLILSALGFSAQLSLKDYPLSTRLSTILLTPLVVFIPSAVKHPRFRTR